ncbi:DUF4262 domain-containing protein [Cytobacillus sp. FJAT-54145]|uniref:DUF4262 domain-containing protein n=1 Tax=Cytobacillus spartinae TaxID=3299023 RepID=A0ABW6KA65_9BACI
MKNFSMDAMLELESQLQDYGWIAHHEDSPDGKTANHHTHGLAENFDHDDFQLVLDVDPRIPQEIFSRLVDLVAEGTVFQEGKRYARVITGFEVEMKRVEEDERELLRVILPDPNGKFPEDDGCEEMYMMQAHAFL